MMDASLCIGQSFLSLMLFAVVAGQYSVKINMSSNKVKQGDNLTITCDVINHLNTYVTMSWMRKHGQQETVISRDGRDVEKFLPRDRYHVTVSESKSIGNKYKSYTFTLTIKALKASDSGDIGCLLPENHIEIFKTLTVLTPVQTMRLNSTDLHNTHATTYMDNQVVNFTEGDVHRFTCSVSGAYPEPRVRVFVGERDISDAFSLVSRLKEEGGKNRTLDGKSQFIENLYYEVVRTNNHLNITHDFNKQRIRCVADLPGSEFPMNSTSIEVRLSDFCPKFECGDEVVARRHQRNVRLICRVISQPAAIKGSFHWKRSTRGNLSIDAGKTDGIFTGYLDSKSVDGYVKEMMLRISHMFPQHFRSYVFQAENRNCISLKEIRIREDTSKDLHSGAASLYSTMITTTTRVIVTAIIIITTTTTATVFVADVREQLT